jgi:hypothetical protein
MKNIWAIIAVICGALSGFTHAQAVNSLSDTLIAKSKAVPQLMKAKDVEGLKSLLADDLRIVGSEGRTHEKGEILGAAQEGFLQDFMFYNPEVIQVDADTAIVTYNLIVSIPEGDDLLSPRYQKISDLWVRQGNDWRLKFEQATPLRPID